MSVGFGVSIANREGGMVEGARVTGAVWGAVGMGLRMDSSKGSRA